MDTKIRSTLFADAGCSSDRRTGPKPSHVGWYGLVLLAVSLTGPVAAQEKSTAVETTRPVTSAQISRVPQSPPTQPPHQGTAPGAVLDERLSSAVTAGLRSCDVHSDQPGLPKGWIKSPAMKIQVRDWRWKYRWYILSGTLSLHWAITVGIGRFAWKWGQSHAFAFHNDGWFNKDPRLDGGSDKFGHLYAMYAIERGFTYIFESAGIPHWIAVLASSLNSVISGVAIEIGDGFTSYYGFSYSDITFDLIGTALGLIQDLYPPLRNVFALSYWYWPSSGFLSKRNPHKEKALTDYSGTKYFFHLLGAGLPYIKQTPMKYLRLDLAFWSRGFKSYDKGFPFHLRQYLYVGISIDFAQLVWDLFPHKWYRTSTYVFLKYFNLYGPIETGYKHSL